MPPKSTVAPSRTKTHAKKRGSHPGIPDRALPRRTSVEVENERAEKAQATAAWLEKKRRILRRAAVFEDAGRANNDIVDTTSRPSFTPKPRPTARNHTNANLGHVAEVSDNPDNRNPSSFQPVDFEESVTPGPGEESADENNPRPLAKKLKVNRTGKAIPKMGRASPAQRSRKAELRAEKMVPALNEAALDEAAYVSLAKTVLCRVYPKDIAAEIEQPEFPDLIQKFINKQEHPDDASDVSIPELFNNQEHSGDDSDVSIFAFPKFRNFYGKIRIYPSASLTFHAPHSISGNGSMRRERIRAVKSWRNGPGRYDTVIVNMGTSEEGRRDLSVARVRLLFSFSRFDVKYSCALVRWLSCVDDSSDDMWVVQPDDDEESPASVIHLDTIVRIAHLRQIS